jgi:hypothetical protein
MSLALGLRIKRRERFIKNSYDLGFAVFDVCQNFPLAPAAMLLPLQ